MKIILLADVKKLGKKGDLIEVSDGYGQNYLIPRKLGAAATDGAVKRRKKEMADQGAKNERELEAAREVAKQLEGKVLTMNVKVGKNDKIFGSVTSADVVKALKAEFGHKVDKKKLDMAKSIRTLGEHKVKVRLAKGVQANVRIELKGESE